MRIKFKSWDCVLHFDEYANTGRTAILPLDADDGGMVATATVNIPSAVLSDGETLIKNWSENEGMLDVLVAAGIVEDTGRKVSTGFVAARVVRLLISRN